MDTLRGQVPAGKGNHGGFIRTGWCPTVGWTGLTAWRGLNVRWPGRQTARAELGACVKVPLVLKHPGGGGRSPGLAAAWYLLGQPWDGPPAPTAQLGLRVLRMFSWFGSEPLEALADLGLAVLSGASVVLDDHL